MDWIGKGQPEKANLPEKERALLRYVKTLTLTPARVTDADVEGLRKLGWTDDQLAEASFNTALFAFFNRMAEAYGLDYGDRAWYPPELRDHPAHKEAERAAAPEKAPVSEKAKK